MVVVINGKRKLNISGQKIASSVYFGLEYSSRNKLTVKVGDEILIDDEKCNVHWTHSNNERWWCFRYNDYSYEVIQDDREGSIRMVYNVQQYKFIHKNFSVEFK
jgi:hypothetical protein